MMKYYIDDVVSRVCENLQLPNGKYEMATERYETIARILQSDELFRNVDLKIYPQGSFRLKTTVKPLSGEEYDLDFVAEISAASPMSPKQLYDHILRILKNDGRHNGMVETKARCIRLNYANEFHMDIMPGKLWNNETGEIIVPDRTLKAWYHHSNPIAYSQWFESRARTYIVADIRGRCFAKTTEPVDEQEIVQRLQPLRRAVQLIKRYRDVYCDQNSLDPVRSIIICTLMGQISSAYADTLEIIRDFCHYVKGLHTANNCKPFEIRNPVVDEVLTEKWEEDPSIYHGFIDMVKKLEEDVINLSSMALGSEVNRQLKMMFGDTVVNQAIIDRAKPIDEARKASSLAVSATGKLNTVGDGAVVKKNNFYG